MWDLPHRTASKDSLMVKVQLLQHRANIVIKTYHCMVWKCPLSMDYLNYFSSGSGLINLAFPKFYLEIKIVWICNWAPAINSMKAWFRSQPVKSFLSSRRSPDIFFFFVIIIQNKIRNKIQRALSVSQSEAAVMSALLHSTDSRKQVDVFIGLIIIKTTNIIISIINQFEISKILQILQRQPT